MNFRFEKSFAGKRVFVTGNTGFKGSWLSLWLSSLGAQVHGFALDPPTTPNNYDVSEVESCIEHQEFADIRDVDWLERSLQRVEPDVVMHLAAQSVVREGYQSPRETFEINVMGTVNVLDAVRKYGKPCAVLAITSDKCYENTERTWGYRECDAMGDHDPYGGSKGAAELAIRSYRHSFFPPERVAEHGVHLASARAGNVIGGGDWTTDALIVDVFRAFQDHLPVEIRSPDACRPWQHVLQCLSGYLRIAAELLESNDKKYLSGWNIGPQPGSEIPVRDVVDAFIDVWGSGEWIDVGDPNAPREASILRLAIDKALWEMDWKPMWSVQESIEQTALWYQHYVDNPSGMREFSLRQIQSYEQELSGAASITDPVTVTRSVAVT